MNPTQVYTSLKTSIDAADAYGGYRQSGVQVDPSAIQMKEVRVAVPPTTNAQQWQQIQRAVDYAESKGIHLTVERAAGN